MVLDRDDIIATQGTDGAKGPDDWKEEPTGVKFPALHDRQVMWIVLRNGRGRASCTRGGVGSENPVFFEANVQKL